MPNAALETQFKNHWAHEDDSTETKEAKDRIAILFRDLAVQIESVMSEGRERSLVMTKLEEAQLFAYKGVVTAASSSKATKK
jgi:hypothetical protein